MQYIEQHLKYSEAVSIVFIMILKKINVQATKETKITRNYRDQFTKSYLSRIHM